MSLQSYFNKIAPLNDTMLQINRLCNDENSSIVDLSRLIAKDPVLTAKILKLANSPLYNFKNVSTTNNAIALFGMTTIKGIILKIVLSDNHMNNISPYNITEDDYLSLSHLQQSIAKSVSRDKNISSLIEKDLILCAFLMDIGKLIASYIMIDKKVDKDFSNELIEVSNYDELEILEQKYLKTNSISLTLKLLEHWKIEVDIQNILKSYIENKNIDTVIILKNIVNTYNVLTIKKHVQK